MDSSFEHTSAFEHPQNDRSPSGLRLSDRLNYGLSRSQYLPNSAAAVGAWEIDLKGNEDLANLAPLNYETGESYGLGSHVFIDSTPVPDTDEQSKAQRKNAEDEGYEDESHESIASLSVNTIHAVFNRDTDQIMAIECEGADKEPSKNPVVFFLEEAVIFQYAIYSTKQNVGMTISQSFASRLGLRPNGEKLKLITQIGHEVEHYGSVNVEFTLPQIKGKFKYKAWVVPDRKPDIVFGRKFVIDNSSRVQGTGKFFKGRFRLLDTPEQQKDDLIDAQETSELRADLFDQAKDVFINSSFRANPDVPFQHEIVLQPEYSIPDCSMGSFTATEIYEMKAIIKSQIDSGIIAPSTSQFASPARVVTTKDGKRELRVDYKKLNKITEKNRWPIPLIDELLDETAGAKLFSKLDFEMGYHQIPLKKEDRYKTAFLTPFGKYEYLVMPFGLLNSAAMFQRAMSEVLSGLGGSFAVVYLGSILVFSETVDQHRQHLSKVFERLAENHLVLKKSNCSLFCNEVTYLGHKISANGLQIKKDVVDLISNWRRLRERQSCQKFLGLCNYYRRFLPNFAGIANPLFQYSAKKRSYDSECGLAFKALKELVARDPILTIADYRNQFRLTVDIKKGAIDATLDQLDQDKNECGTIGFYSARLNPKELEYELHESLLLATCKALSHWNYYLECSVQPVIIRLKYASFYKKLQESDSKVSERIMELFDEITAYDVELHHCINLIPRITQDRASLLKWIASLSGCEHDCERLGAGPIDFDHRLANSPQIKQLQVGIDSDNELGLIKAIITAGAGAYIPRYLESRIKGYRIFDGLLLYCDEEEKIRICVANNKHRTELILRSYALGHEDPESITEHLSQKLYWPNMQNMIRKTLKLCSEDSNAIEQEQNASTMHSYASLRPWASVTMYFASQRINEKYNMLWIVVDRLSKEAHFIPCNRNDTLGALAIKFIKVVINLHGIPQEIASNRDASFIDKFWTAVNAELGVSMKLHVVDNPHYKISRKRTDRMVFKKIYGTYPFRAYRDWHVILPIIEETYNARRRLNSSSVSHMDPEASGLRGAKNTDRFIRQLNNKLQRFDI